MRGPSQILAPVVTEVAQYEGQPAIGISATGLGRSYTSTAARRVVDRWCEFLAAGPSPITDLTFVSRTPKRLFDSLRAQTQLEVLRVKWGDYDDLGVLRGMTRLTQLYLGGASAVTSLDPLAALPQLRELVVESLRHVHDLSPLGALTDLVELEVGGDGIAPRRVHVDSLAFLHRLTRLERLALVALVVDDLDHSPLLAHRDTLTDLRLGRQRGMRPSYDELAAAIPALSPRR